MIILNQTILDVSNHAIKRWNERFYKREANMIDAFLKAKKLKRKQSARLKKDTTGKVLYKNDYCMFICKKVENTLVMLTVVPWNTN